MKGYLVATWKMAFESIQKGQNLLKEGATIHKAVIEAVKTVENNPLYHSVGYGALPNCDGEVELDAAYMDGDTLGFGGVMGVKNIKNPIEVAYDLCHYKRNSLLTAGGAEEYARKRGYEFSDMLTDETKMRYEEQPKNIDMEQLEAYGGHDTVCIIGNNGSSIACGVSTSGLFMKLPGRVGDSPLIGSGCYADSEIGAAAATGVGEDIMKGCLSFAIVEKLKHQVPVQQACEDVLNEHIARLNRSGHCPSSISRIAMVMDHNIGATTNQNAFPFVVGDMEGNTVLYIAINEDNKMSVIRPTQAWIDAYEGD